MKRIFTWLLILAALVLTGCRAEADALMGSWYAQVDVQQVLDRRLERESPEFASQVAPGAFPVTVVLSFYADGTYQAGIDPESVDAACRDYTARVEAGLWQYLQQLHALQGLDMTLEQYLQSLGITREELMEEVIGESLAQELLLELGVREEGWFALKKGRLFLMEQPEQEPSDYHSVQVEGQTLTLRPGKYEKQSSGAYYEAHLPMRFHRSPEENE